MGVTGQNIRIGEGDRKEFTVEVDGYSTLSGALIKWAVSYDSADSPLILKSSTSSDITIDGFDVTVVVKAVDTIGLRGKYTHELRIYEGGINPEKVTIGSFTVIPAITNQTTGGA